jgi:hypothetical protein
MMGQWVGHYRLDDEAKVFFEAPIMHIMRRGNAVVGRFGRRGVISGSMKGLSLEARWKSRERAGWLRVTFDPAHQSFSGDYGLEVDTPAVGRCEARIAAKARQAPPNPAVKDTS